MTITQRARDRASRLRERSTVLRRHAEKLARRVWMKLALRGTRFSDNHARIDAAYRVEDPWVMSSPKEQYRFERTNQIIESHLGRPESILEIGCGEGHQTEHLARLCEHMYGLDVSKTAIERARRRCPDAELAPCDLASQPFKGPGERFDVVAACEVLYYMEDVEEALRTMERLGKKCLVTYYRGAGTEPLTPLLDARPGAQSESFSFENVTWRAVWWTSPAE
jgi:2-polyprenyl-3-methyl-5-hydroxy-6-metoxy-1,4-benzoquinol methylase